MTNNEIVFRESCRNMPKCSLVLELIEGNLSINSSVYCINFEDSSRGDVIYRYDIAQFWCYEEKQEADKYLDIMKAGFEFIYENTKNIREEYKKELEYSEAVVRAERSIHNEILNKNSSLSSLEKFIIWSRFSEFYLFYPSTRNNIIERVRNSIENVKNKSSANFLKRYILPYYYAEGHSENNIKYVREKLIPFAYYYDTYNMYRKFKKNIAAREKLFNFLLLCDDENIKFSDWENKDLDLELLLNNPDIENFVYSVNNHLEKDAGYSYLANLTHKEMKKLVHMRFNKKLGAKALISKIEIILGEELDEEKYKEEIVIFKKQLKEISPSTDVEKIGKRLDKLSVEQYTSRMIQYAILNHYEDSENTLNYYFKLFVKGKVSTWIDASSNIEEVLYLFSKNNISFRETLNSIIRISNSDIVFSRKNWINYIKKYDSNTFPTLPLEWIFNLL